MADSLYMAGRSAYSRPQAIVWANEYEKSNGKFVPTGTEFEDFIILSDHNRSDISISCERIENKKRMINGTMRSYHIADKQRISFSWNLLPSRAFSASATFSNLGILTNNIEDYTADLGAGGVDVVNWYENHTGSFYILLAYDKYNEFTENPYGHLAEYNQVLHVFFSSFDHNVIKRGGTNHDLWDISVSLEEV